MGQETTFKKKSHVKEVWRLFLKNKPAVAGLVILAVMAIVLVAGMIFIPESRCYDVTGTPFQTPSKEHIFGTDNIGRDILARIVFGSKVSLSIAFSASIISVLIGAFIGALCGYYGGIVDNIIMRFLDVIACIPGMLLVMALVVSLGVNARNLLIALVVSSVPSYVRFVRATIINLSDMEYIECARSYGTSSLHIIIKHVLPNALGPIIIQLAGSIAGTILCAASYSYLGFGVQPPTPEWGAMVSVAKTYMRMAPHILLFPGGAIVLSAISINLIGDGLRDALDPRLKD